jgi:hypothetical protein
MRVILRDQRLHRLGRQAREPSDITTHLVAQDRDWVLGFPGGVQPPLDRRATEADLKTGERMTPGLSRQGTQGSLQLTFRRWRRQQRADDREAQPRPPIAVRQIVT